MKVIILAAGLGTRMKDLTKDTPKPMLPIQGKPKLAYTLEILPEEITEVIFIVGYLQEQIREFFGEEYAGKKIKYIVQEKLNGTAGAVALAKDEIGSEKVLVMMGDDLYNRKDLEKILQYEQALLAYETDEAEQFGLVDTDKDGYLTAVVEKPHNKTKGLVNTAAYVLSPEYFNTPLVAISETEFGLPQTLVKMYPEHKTKVVRTTKWLPIGSPEDLEIAQEKVKDFL
jgi:bifunctional UDP-N-acetylglucosamine pyrophosphorylase/glucosamine-1-phosphate N-acetyltransferase